MLKDRKRNLAFDAITGRANGLVPFLLRFVLLLLSLVYVVGLKIFMLPYRLGIRKHKRLPCPVISVGNLTFGGTGKTPTVRVIASQLLARGLRPVILSRGHGGKSNRSATVASDGNERRMSVDECGDEPAMLADLLPGVPVVIGKNRYESGMLAIGAFNPGVIVLDDGMQYWQLHRDLDIALLNAVEPFGCGGVMPRGTLREPASGLRRAGIVVITNADQVTPERLAQVKDRVAALAQGAPIVEARHRPSGFRFLDGEKTELDWLRGRRVCAMSSIGAPDIFKSSIINLGAEIVGEFDFPDHHLWEFGELTAIGAETRRIGAEALVTTEKDAVKIPNGDFGIPIAVVDVTLEFRNGSALADAILRSAGVR